MAMTARSRQTVARSRARRGSWSAWALAGALALAAFAPAANAQARLGGVSVDRVRLPGGGRAEAWVSVVDPDGGPVTGLSTREFSVAWDGRTPQDLMVVPVADRDPAFQLTVLIDPDVLRERGGMVRSMLESLAGRADSRDQLKIAFASGSGKSARGPLDHGGDLAARLSGDVRGDGRLYDAIFREVRDLARLSKGHAGAVLVVTRGIESGSHHDVPEILEISRAYAQHVPVIVLQLDTQGGGGDGDRLSRLGVISGGGYERLDNADALSGAAVRAVRRLRGGYFVSFRDLRWDARAEHHGLDVTVNSNGEQRSRHREVNTAESASRSSWLTLTLVVLGMVFLLALIAVPLLWRRPLIRLVVLNGDEKGCSYELFATPVTLGAAVGNDLSFDDDLVSRNHAVFERRGSAVELVDLNSENGTFVNGDRISRRRLSKGDRVSLGGAIDLEVAG